MRERSTSQACRAGAPPTVPRRAARYGGACRHSARSTAASSITGPAASRTQSSRPRRHLSRPTTSARAEFLERGAGRQPGAFSVDVVERHIDDAAARNEAGARQMEQAEQQQLAPRQIAGGAGQHQHSQKTRTDAGGTSATVQFLSSRRRTGGVHGPCRAVELGLGLGFGLGLSLLPRQCVSIANVGIVVGFGSSFNDGSPASASALASAGRLADRGCRLLPNRVQDAACANRRRHRSAQARVAAAAGPSTDRRFGK